MQILINKGRCTNRRILKFSYFLILNQFSGSMGSVTHFSWEKQFNRKDQQHANTCGSSYFDKESEKRTKLQPLQHDHIGMVK